MDMIGNQSENRTFAKILGSIEEHFPTAGKTKEPTFYFVHVHIPPGNAEMEIEDPAYIVSLDKSNGILGLKLAAHATKRSLLIKEVLGGLASEYNATAPVLNQVKPGDRIVRVNAVEADCKMMLEECKKQAHIELEIHRGSAVPLTTGLAASVKIPFGNFKMGEEGIVINVDDEGDALLKMPGFGRSQWIVKADFHKFIFDEQDRYYLKRFEDFRDIHAKLKAKIANKQEESKISSLPDCPPDETFGFRRGLAALGMGGFMTERKDGLQKMMDEVLSQVEMLEDEPLIAQFFASPVPKMDVPKENILKQRLEQLVANHHDKVLLAPLTAR